MRRGRCGPTGSRTRARGKVRRYTPVRGRDFHGTGKACQSLGGARLDKTVAGAFLEAVAPAGIAATAAAIRQLEDQHEQRVAGQRVALERAQYEADRAQRKFDACEPETGLSTAPSNTRWNRRSRSLSASAASSPSSTRRPRTASDPEREALLGLARELPRLWAAESTPIRERKELLRTLIGEVIVTPHHDTRRAAVEVQPGRRRADRAARPAQGRRHAGAGSRSL